MKLYKHCSVFILSILLFLALPLASSGKFSFAGTAFADTGFTSIYNPNPSTSHNYVHAVSAYDASHVWAVGSYQGTDGNNHDLIEYWNGTRWTQQTGANPGVYSYLSSVKALSATNIWAVGSYADATNNQYVLIEHSTDGGQTWIQDTSSYTGGGLLTSIDGDPSTGDAWAVGNILNTGGSYGAPLTLQLVNGHFSSQANVSPNSNMILNGVSERTSSDVWAVGYYVPCNFCTEIRTLTLHFDGSGWSTVTSPFDPGGQDFLYSVKTVSANDVWAVGYAGNPNSPETTTLTMHWEYDSGSNQYMWKTKPSPNPSTLDDYLFSVTAASSNNVWAVGYTLDSNPTTGRTLAINWNGSGWSTVSSQNPSSYTNYLQGVTAVSDSNVWAVGYSTYPSTGVDDTLIEHNAPPAAAFLELPFHHSGSFYKAATAINSYFDHEYPLLGGGISEPTTSVSGFSGVTPAAAVNNTVMNYTGARQLDGNFNFQNASSYPKIYYSSHDGYDYGTDAGLSLGSSVYAAAAGTATFTNTCGACGHEVKIDHHNGYQTIYMHLNDSWISTMSGQQADVAQGDLIGHVGNTGTGSKGAHLHFGVYQDQHGSGTFTSDDITDPFGWEPAKDATSQSKDPDPWETNFTLNGQPYGNKSAYLWKHSLDSLLQQYLSQDGGTLNLDDYTIDIPSATLTSPATFNMVPTTYTSTVISGTTLHSVLPILDANAWDLSGNPITTLSNPYTMTIDYSTALLQNINADTLSIYSSSDGVTWTKETTTLDTTNKKASAQINHFTQFALMGEVADTVAPTTTAQLSGTQGGQANTYTSDVTVTLNATDNTGGSGIQFTSYRIDGGEWQVYSTPFTVSAAGQHTVDYYSEDNGGNIETVNTNTFTIVTTFNLTGTVYIDANNNGVQDTGESGYLGATVSLNTGQTATTDSSGNYSFSNLPTGTYTETLTVPTGYVASTTNPVTIALNEDTTQNFGITTIIANDTFQRSNQTYWGTASDGQAWGADASNNNHFSISSNTGLASGTSGILSGVLGPSKTDEQVLVTVKSSSYARNTDPDALLRYTDANNWYKAYLDGSNLVIRKNVAGTNTQIASAAFSATTNTLYTIRFQVVGEILSAKAWASSGSEPSNWTVSVDDTALTSGKCGIGINNAVGANITFTSFTAYSIPPTAVPTPSAPSGGTLGSKDTFQRSNQTYWGTASDGNAWGADASNNSTFSISGSTGKVTGSTAGIVNGTLGTSANDSEVDAIMSATAFTNSSFGVVLRYTDSNNLYKAYLDGSNIKVAKMIGGATTTLATATFNAGIATPYSIRFKAVGPNLYAKVWASNSTEPTSWTVTTTDTNLISGKNGVVLNLANAIATQYLYFASYSFSTPTTVANDTFQRSNQTYWGTASDGHAWGDNASNVSNFSISSNTGQVSGTSGIENGILGSSISDGRVFATAQTNSFSNTDFGVLLRFTNDNNWYKAYIDGSNLVIRKMVNGTNTQLASTHLSTSANTSYNIRFQAVGTSLQAKVWASSSSEPASWTLSTTDSNLTSGNAGVGISNTGGNTVKYTSFNASQL